MKMETNRLLSVTVNRESFAYDIHSLVKAFYPDCDVKVFSSEEKRESSGPGKPDLDIHFTEEAVLCALTDSQEGTASFHVNKVEISQDMPRIEVKNRLKQLLYVMLSQYTGKQLPWGALTGIRPVKIPMSMLEEGADEASIMDYMKDTYFISEEKGALAIEIAKREREILNALREKRKPDGEGGSLENAYSLYIDIPFCPTTCLYCSFTSYPIAAFNNQVEQYLTALEKEIDFAADLYGDKRLDTIYIGGGTPTTLEAPELERLFTALEEKFDLSNLKEFTLEAGRPDSITLEKLRTIKRHGVTRISVNPQTMNQETLDLIGRRHTVKQVREAFAMARAEDFDNINMDLILGLPGEGAAEVQETMRGIAELSPDSLTVHSLAVKRASRLSRWVAENGLDTMRNTEETMRITMDGARQMGMFPYYLYRQKNMSGNFENVGYAREGKYGIYNILIMEEVQDILALGAGSISKRIFPDGRIERCENVKELAQYIGRIDEMIERKRTLFRDQKFKIIINR